MEIATSVLRKCNFKVYTSNKHGIIRLRDSVVHIESRKELPHFLC